MKALSELANQRWLRRSLYGLVAFLVVAILAIWLGGPPTLRWAIETVAARELGRTLRVGEIRTNPFTLTARLNDLVVEGAAGDSAPLLTVGELRANISLGSILRLAPVLDRLAIDRFSANVVRLEPQRFNFSDIVERLLARPASDKPARYSVNNIELTDGAIRFDDRVRRQVNTVTDIRLAIPFISSLPTHADVLVQPAFFARVDGAPLELKGETLPFDASLETAVNLKLEGLDIPKYLSFSPVRLNFQVPRGELDAELRIAFHRAVAATQEQPARPAELLISGPVAVRDFSLEAPAGASVHRLVAWRRLGIAIEEYGVFANRIRLREVALDAPELDVARDGSGRINWLEFVAAPIAVGTKSAPAAGTTPTRPLDLALATLKVNEGRLVFTDASVGKFSKQLEAITVEAHQVATLGGKPATVKASARSADGESLEAEGEVRVSQRAGRLKVGAKEVDVRALTPYLETLARARFDGRLDASSVLEFDASQTPATLQASELSVAARKLRVEGAPALGARLDVASLAVEGGSADVNSQKLEIQKVTIDGPSAVVTRLADGTIGWASLPPPGRTSAAATSSPPWQIRVATAEIARGEVQFTDRSVEPEASVRLSSLTANASELTADGAQRAQFNVRARVGKAGSIAADGNARWDRLAATVRVNARNLDIAALRPYFAQQLNAEFASAELSSRGTLTLTTPPRGAAMRLAYTGDARLANVHLLNPGGEGDLLKWNLLEIDRVALQFSDDPPQIEVGTVALSDYFARLVLSEQGRLNLQDIVRGGQAAEAAATGAETPATAPTPAPAAAQTAPTATASSTEPRPLIRIGGIRLERGNVNFTDNYIKPNYAANLTGVGGTVGALASDSAAPAELVVNAKVDDDAPVEIKGRLNPLAPALFLDIAGSAKGVDLPRFTPYSAKYAGYPITKGKLSVDVSYKVDGGKLEARNRLFLDQLTFGDRIESPSATKLPVLLAVALLKNSRGEIDINLPISGSLNDPQFSIGAIVVRLIINLLVKAATAPFALLAAAFGGGEELGYIEFTPGSSALAAAQTQRLGTLAKALSDRPGLRLDVIGWVDPASDIEGLRRVKYEAKLRAAKLRELVRAGGASVDPSSVTIDPAERGALIGRVYSDEKIPNKPRNVLGFAKTIPAPEMEKLILANIAVTPDDLRALANARATVVRHHLESEGKIAPERLFLVDPKLTPEGIKDKGAATRVDFSLK